MGSRHFVQNVATHIVARKLLQDYSMCTAHCPTNRELSATVQVGHAQTVGSLRYTVRLSGKKTAIFLGQISTWLDQGVNNTPEKEFG